MERIGDAHAAAVRLGEDPALRRASDALGNVSILHRRFAGCGVDLPARVDRQRDGDRTRELRVTDQPLVVAIADLGDVGLDDAADDVAVERAFDLEPQRRGVG
jgi:hypothetical protein